MENPLLPYLEADDTVLEGQWERLQEWLAERFGKEPGLEGTLFLIGIQSRGHGFEPNLDREAKQSLIMEGTYCAFETLGVYARVGLEEDGHWIWERLIDHPPNLPVEAQEKLLRTAILRYFDTMLEASDAHET